MFVVLAVFGREIFDLSKKIFANVVEITDDKFVASTELKEYRGGLEYLRGVQRLNIPDKNFDKNFREQLLALIESRDVKNSEFYTAANVSAKVFSDIHTKKKIISSRHLTAEIFRRKQAATESLAASMPVSATSGIKFRTIRFVFPHGRPIDVKIFLEVLL